MTLPYERTRAVLRTADFLRNLCDPKLTPKVPRHIRESALRLLKHYPTEHEMRQAEAYAPQVFGPP